MSYYDTYCIRVLQRLHDHIMQDLQCHAGRGNTYPVSRKLAARRLYITTTEKNIILHTTVMYYGIGDVGESSDKQVSPTFRPRAQIQS